MVLSKAISYSLSLLQIFNLVLKIKPDVIHIQWIRLFLIDWLYISLFKKFSKVVYTAHNILPHTCKPFDKKLYKIIYHTVDSIIVHTYDSKMELMKYFHVDENKIYVIPHGLLKYNMDEEKILLAKDHFNEKYDTNNKIVIVSLGVQSFYKGSDIIAQSWIENESLHSNMNLKLLIFGKNQNIDFSKLNKFTNVHIENRFLTDEEFIAVLNLSDIILLPYRKISQSGVLLTALSERVPVIISDIAGLKEAISIADIGWNIGEPTSKNLSETLLDLIQNSDHLLKKKNNDEEWKKIEDYYDWDSIAFKTYRLYNQVCNKNIKPSLE
jgi:glycosyltransferase involved in cell wall biosynthesis